MACSQQRSVYLITYSDADLTKVDSRGHFADIWCEAFGEDYIDKWVCSCEKHKNGEGVHFHLALKLNRVKRWKLAKQTVQNQHDIVCYFREFHTNYYDAYSYVTKKDSEYLTSTDHPVLNNSPPPTKNASRKRISSASDVRKKLVKPVENRKREECLDITKLYDIVIENNLKTEQDLFLLVNRQNQEGKKDLLNFVMRMSEKQRGEILKTAWRVHQARDVEARSKKSTIELFEEYAEVTVVFVKACTQKVLLKFLSQTV